MPGVITPSSSTATAIQPGVLDLFAAEMSGFVGLRLAPDTPVDQDSGVYETLSAANLVRKPSLTARADGAPALRSTIEFSKKTWACKQNSLAADISDREREIYTRKFGIELMAVSRRRLTYSIMARHEAAIAALVNTTTFPLSGTTGYQGTAWGTPSTSTPVTDFHVVRQYVLGKCGMPPNTIVFPNVQTAWNFVLSDEVRSSIGLANNDRTNLSVQASAAVIGAILDVPNVLIANAWGVNDYQPVGTPASLWDANLVLAAYVNPDPDPTALTFARTFRWTRTGSFVSGMEYRQDLLSATSIEVTTDTDEQVVSTDCAAVIDITP